MNQKKSRGSGRTRTFACIIYPESLPENWREIIVQWHTSVLLSPLHDKDVNPFGETKKAHYHMIITFDSVKSIEQIEELISPLNGAKLVEKVNSLRGYARYLCHLDNPEKARYDVNEVQAFGGIDYRECIALPSDSYLMLSEILDFICENHIHSFATLVDYCRKNNMEWFIYLTQKGTYFVKEYIKTKTWEDRTNYSDDEVGN